MVSINTNSFLMRLWLLRSHTCCRFALLKQNAARQTPPERDAFIPELADQRKKLLGIWPVSGGYPSRGYINPRSARDITSPWPITIWSRTLISTSPRASFSRRVRDMSAWLGSATPDGWLWAKITAA